MAVYFVFCKTQESQIYLLMLIVARVCLKKVLAAAMTTLWARWRLPSSVTSTASVSAPAARMAASEELRFAGNWFHFRQNFWPPGSMITQLTHSGYFSYVICWCTLDTRAANEPS